LALETLFADPQVKAALAQDERLVINGKGQVTDWLCPTDPRNQEQLLAVVTEIVLGYRVSGIQLDYFRFDGTDTCLCPRCRVAFERQLGRRFTRWPQEVLSGDTREDFLVWRSGVLTDLLRQLRAQLQAVRPDALLSVACFPNWETCPRNFGQDPMTWASEGLVDFLCPMNYTSSLEKFSGLVRTQAAHLSGTVPLAAGIGAFSDACQFDTPQELADQIQASRQAGAQGFVVFNLNDRFMQDFLPWIELGLTKRPSPLAWEK
jgi:uncharacterized lipoprotein YddW (UPF0748 family)